MTITKDTTFNTMFDVPPNEKIYILETACDIVNGDRQNDYGEVEDNFTTIAHLWDAYVSSLDGTKSHTITPKDVAIMMILLKVARTASGHGKQDNWIDIAGYAACGGEIESRMKGEK